MPVIYSPGDRYLWPTSCGTFTDGDRSVNNVTKMFSASHCVCVCVCMCVSVCVCVCLCLCLCVHARVYACMCKSILVYIIVYAFSENSGEGVCE